MPKPPYPQKGAQNPQPQGSAGHTSRRFLLPKEVSTQAQSIPTCSNAGLWLDHFTEWEERGSELKRAEASDKRQRIPKSFNIPELYSLLSAWKNRWDRMLDDYMAHGYVVQRFILQAASRVIVGLGAESVLETSIRLHRIYGFPIIPGSALKGLARAYAKLVEGKEESDPLFTDIFGKSPPEARAGKVIFFDAIPANPANLKLELDVMNPHYVPYYQGNEPPADYHSLVPIFFLTIAPGSEFLFALASRDGSLAEHAMNYLQQGLTELGIGAKTTSGYGFWKNSKFDLITFLGTGQYKEVEYVWSKRDGDSPGPFRTKFFPEAVLHFLAEENIAKVLVLVTEQAKKGDNFKELNERLGEKLSPIDIPEGKAESELWQIFDKIVSEVKEKDKIILDITHGFRSIPMIVFSIADYLRKIKSVDIKYILYGAYEAGEDTESGIKRVPVFDLTPLLDLIEWAGGLETFLKKGEAKLIGEKIHEKHQSLDSKKEESQNKTNNLKNVGEKLNEISTSLHLVRPKEVLRDAHDLLEVLEKAKNELHAWVKPFAAILDRIQEEVKDFAYKDYDKLTRDNLKKQLALIWYYHNKGLFLQATLLIREWIISYVILNHFLDKHEEWDIRSSRQEAEKFLNESRHPKKNKSGEIIKYWVQVSKLRNNLAHCGMSKDSSDLKDIESKVMGILEALDKLLRNSSAGAKSR